MNKIFTYLICLANCVILLLPDPTTAQTLNDGPIQLQVKVRNVNTTFGGPSDAAIAGVGFLPDEYRYKIWIRDNPNIGPAGWQGGGCLQSNFNPPQASADFNTVLFNHTYAGAIVPQFFDMRVEAWEDDLPSDNVFGVCGQGNTCTFDGNTCCQNTPFGCLYREEDDRHCNSNPFRTSVNFRVGNPCEWYDHGFLTRNSGMGSGDCNSYQPRIETFWRYMQGDVCSNPIDLGLLMPGGSLTHFNSTACYNNSWTASQGNDVFYKFTINQPAGVRVSLCGTATWNTNLYLLDASCTQLYFNNNGATCAPQSQILENLCVPGDYIVVVDGNTSIESGVFTLSIVEDPSAGLNVVVNSNNVSCHNLTDGEATAIATGGTSPYTYSWTGPGGFTSTDPGISNLAAGFYTIDVMDQQSCLVSETIEITQPNPLGLTLTGVDPTCYLGNDASVTVATSTGGTTPYVYGINGGPFQSSPTFNNLPAAIHTITIRDANNCQQSADVKLIDPAEILVNAVSTPESCAGFSDGTITANPSGGVAPYSCALGFPQIFSPCAVYTGLSAGSHVITVRDADGCEAVANINITLAPAITVSLVPNSKVNVSCNGYSDGAFEVNAAGGTTPLEYSNNGGATYQAGPVFNGLPADDYPVVVRDANGCTNSINVEITEPTVLILSNLFQIPISCNGLSDGSVVVTASGGVGPYLYSLDSVNFYQSGFFTNLPGGTYNFHVTDNNGCPASLTLNTIEPDSLFVNVTAITAASCLGIDNGSLTLNGIGGTPPYEYSLNNGPYQSNPVFNGLAAGSYLIGIKDNSDCLGFGLVNGIRSDSATVGENISVTANVNWNNVACNGGNSGSIAITNPLGTLPFQYSIDGGIIFQASGDFDNLAAGNYLAVAQDASGCRYTENVVITQPPVLTATVNSITDASCPNISDGSVLVDVQGGTGTGTYSYVWSNLAITKDLINVNGGNYVLTVTDANQCEFVLPVTIGQPAPLFIDITNIQDVSCAGQSDGRIEIDIIGGVGPLSYLWSNGSATHDLHDVPAGSYTVVITDGANCQTAAGGVVNAPQPLNSTITATGVTCATSADADITLNVMGGTPPYRFLWSYNLTTTQDLIGVPAGSYTVIVEDENGCTITNSTTINSAPGLEASFNISNVSCAGNNNGQLEILVTGGVPPYIYNWSNNQSGPMISGLSPGIYNVTVTDAINCQGSFSTLVEEPASLLLAISGASVECYGDNNGLAIPLVYGGVPPYTYQWSHGDSNAILTNLKAGTYILTATDDNNCIVIESIQINEPPELTVGIATTNNVTCVSGDDGKVTVFASGGVPPYNYSVRTNRFQDSAIFYGLTAGDYGIMVIDENDCRATNEFTVVEPTGFTVNLPPYIFMTRGTSKELIPEIESITTILSYEWTPADYLSCPDCPNPTVTPAEDIIYTLIVTDEDGCIASDEIAIVLKERYEIFIPNAFTPNGDGVNDVFQPIDYGAAKRILIRIYNRWGGVVFESTSIDNGWDGTMAGEVIQPGVYVYQITGEFLNGEEFDETGSIALLR